MLTTFDRLDPDFIKISSKFYQILSNNMGFSAQCGLPIQQMFVSTYNNHRSEKEKPGLTFFLGGRFMKGVCIIFAIIRIPAGN